MWLTIFFFCFPYSANFQFCPWHTFWLLFIAKSGKYWIFHFTKLKMVRYCYFAPMRMESSCPTETDSFFFFSRKNAFLFRVFPNICNIEVIKMWWKSTICAKEHLKFFSSKKKNARIGQNDIVKCTRDIWTFCVYRIQYAIDKIAPTILPDEIVSLSLIRKRVPYFNYGKGRPHTHTKN